MYLNVPCGRKCTESILMSASSDMDENISHIEDTIFAILTKNTSLQHYVQIAMIQSVFECALFSRLKVQMHKDLKIGQRPWNWQQYAL